MALLAVIGGTGLRTLEGLETRRRERCPTPFGEPSAPLVWGSLGGREIVFLARHGERGNIPPHKVNYRANIWALRHSGASEVVAVAAVGGIARDLCPGALVIPDQIVDYTWSRGHTFYEEDLERAVHIDFTDPYCAALREKLLHAAADAKVEVRDGGTYAATQGPRLETAAEVNRLERDGCHIVGMTGMPEASLARELELCYAACAVVANAAAGRGSGPITMEDIERDLATGMVAVRRLLEVMLFRE